MKGKKQTTKRQSCSRFATGKGGGFAAEFLEKRSLRNLLKLAAHFKVTGRNG
jgi:hypothetical protein